MFRNFSFLQETKRPKLYLKKKNFLNSQMGNPLNQRDFIFIWFYGISTLACYLMPNSFYTYILDMICNIL